jgi:hypothetical protein
VKSELEYRFGRFEEQIALRLGERSGSITVAVADCHLDCIAHLALLQKWP